MSKDFEADLKIGDYGEELWVKHLRSKGYTNVFMSDKDAPVYWDVMLADDDEVLTFEVKYDEKAYYWAEKHGRSPNLFLEYWSESREQPCGIMVLEADYLVYIMKRIPCGTPEAYVFRVQELQSYLKKAAENSTYRVVKNSVNGNNNVKGWAAPVEAVAKSECGFVKQIKLKP